MKLWMRWAAAGVVGIAAMARSADVDVVKTGSLKTAVDLTAVQGDGSAAAKTFAETLERDLLLSGWFTVAPKGSVRVEAAPRASGAQMSVPCTVLNAAAGQTYFRRTFTGEAAKSRYLAHAVADAIVLAVKGRPGIASTRLAMVGTRPGGKELYVCDADGQGLIQLTKDRSVCISPKWSRDAANVFYTSYHGGFPDAYMIELASGRRQRVSGYPGLNAGAAPSPNGREIAITLSKDGNPDLYIVNLQSRQARRLTRTPNTEACPTWSPDGSHIAFVSDRSGSAQTYVIPSSGGAERRITFRGNENVSPNWGPDGRIVLSSRRGGRYQLVTIEPQSATEVQLTFDYVDHESPSWAPDSRHIAYTRTESYHSDVYLLDTMGDPPVRLTRVQGDWRFPAWSPR